MWKLIQREIMRKPDGIVNICMDKVVITYFLQDFTNSMEKRVLLQLVVPELVKKFFSIYETRIFVTMVTAACHLPQS
jgi:hypothetical protein